jgi:hypothetical protein
LAILSRQTLLDMKYGTMVSCSISSSKVCTFAGQNVVFYLSVFLYFILPLTIARSCHCSPTTIGAIIERYNENNLTWPGILQMDDTFYLFITNPNFLIIGKHNLVFKQIDQIFQPRYGQHEVNLAALIREL